MYGGARRGIETLTLTHDHIPIYPVYNSRFPCVHAKGCVHDFPLGRGKAPPSEKNRGEIRPQIANHMFCMGLAEKSFNVFMGLFI